MKDVFLELIPNDILSELEKTLTEFFGSDVSIRNTLPEDIGEGLCAPVMIHGQEAGFICAYGLKATKKNKAFVEGSARVLSKLLYHKYLQTQRTESMERTMKSQSEFLAQFAEDVKTSVREIVLYLSDALKEESDSEIRKSIDVLIARTLKIGSFAEENQDYAETIDGVFELNETVYDINDVVENQISRNMERASGNGDTLNCMIDEDVPSKLMGDPGHVGTILGKLIENSIRYTENSFVNVRISVERSTYGCILVIRVSDGGVGIDPKQAEYIRNYMESRGFSDVKNEEFEMLGFSLIGFCVNAMSGRIGISSAMGEGTTFEIRLPQLAIEGGAKDEF